jgi:N-acetyl-alpha-D-glucosaminyl L-malate synthase BshA
MRIGIACHPTVGGSGVVATELARALAEGGDEVHLMSYAVPPRWSWAGPRLFFHEVAVAQYPLFEYPPYDLALATKMVEVARQHGLDLLHVHYAVPNAVSAILARQILAPQPIKVITTLHGTDITLVGNDPSYVETTRFGIVESDLVTAVSESLRRATHETFQIDKPIEVVPNFIDPQRYHDAVARDRGQRLGAPRFGEPGERILVHISNFRRVKRVGDVISIFHRVAQELPCRLLLVGDGPDLPRAERQARELGVRDRVDLIGTVATIEDVLAHADLFLLPSETESFGLAALEALSCEVPVVASRVGGLPEVIRDGENGFLRPVGDVAGMAEAALSLLRDEDRRRAFGVAGRRWAETRFSRDDVVARYRAVYDRALGLARGPDTLAPP